MKHDPTMIELALQSTDRSSLGRHPLPRPKVSVPLADRITNAMIRFCVGKPKLVVILILGFAAFAPVWIAIRSMF